MTPWDNKPDNTSLIPALFAGELHLGLSMIGWILENLRSNLHIFWLFLSLKLPTLYASFDHNRSWWFKRSVVSFCILGELHKMFSSSTGFSWIFSISAVSILRGNPGFMTRRSVWGITGGNLFFLNSWTTTGEHLDKKAGKLQNWSS